MPDNVRRAIIPIGPEPAPGTDPYLARIFPADPLGTARWITANPFKASPAKLLEDRLPPRWDSAAGLGTWRHSWGDGTRGMAPAMVPIPVPILPDIHE